MVDKKIWKDLLSYKIPIIAVGDHGQLPPIKGKFNLMEDPNLRLEKIHRQAKGNPIIEYSILARKEGKVPVGSKRSATGKVTKISQTDPYAQNEMESKIRDYTNDTMILCGYNNTRTRLNKFIREALGFTTPEPQRNDRVICLRNNYEKNIFNGMLGTIREIRVEDEKWYKTLIEMDDEDNKYDGYISREQFNNPQSLNFTEQRSQTVHGDLFDFGYALTVHKAQGSQSPKVILFEQRFKNMDDDMWKKWLYTGITRAENELFIIGK
jgi:exodeoxyribonuclease-5